MHGVPGYLSPTAAPLVRKKLWCEIWW